jgi:hypothetical protein
MDDKVSSSSYHAQFSFSFLLSLPTEVIEVILNLVLHDLVLDMNTRQRPRFIISQYRALILTCTRFKSIIDHARPRLHMKFTAKCQQIGDHEGYYPNIHFITDENIHQWEKEKSFTERYFTEWSVIFKVYQKISIRHADYNYEDENPYLDAIGKFWLNDRLSFGDFRATVRDHPEEQLDVFLILGQVIQKRSCSIERATGDVATLPDLEWLYLHRNAKIIRRPIEISPVINYVVTRWWKPRYLYSIRDWRIPSDPTLCGSLIKGSEKVSPVLNFTA